MSRAPCIGGLLASAMLMTLGFAGPIAAQTDGSWPPIDPADLKLTDYAGAPGAPAVILDYWDETNNTQSNETIRIRSKVLRDEGKKLGQVEIAYLEKYMQVESIQARTVAPDGTVTPFSGAPMDKEILRARRYKLNAKVLALPNVQVGTIIDYSYRLHWKKGFPDLIKHPGQFIIDEPIAYPAADWEVQRDTFVRRAHLSLRAYGGSTLKYFFLGLPNKPPINQDKDGSIRLELQDVPAYEEEEAAPPEESLRGRIEIFYTYGFWDPDSFWIGLAKQKAKTNDEFFKKSGRAHEEVQRLLAPGDSDEQKLRKLYARVQQIRMISFEESKTEKEIKREELKENKNVDDVLSRNYAYANEVDLVFVAMARAAGFRAYPVYVTSRESKLFDKQRYDPEQLNAMVVSVSLNGKHRFFDPATMYCPFDLVPWFETDTQGVVADTTNAMLVQVDALPSTAAVTRRSADLKLDAEGGLEGEIHITFEGQEALARRIDARHQDETQRRKELEDWLKESVPRNSELTLNSCEGFDKTEGPLTATFHARTLEYASIAGQRMLMPVSFFGSSKGSSFYTTPRRVNPVYFRHAAEYHDTVDITVPKEIAIESVPSTELIDRGAVKFDVSVERKAQTVYITQDFVVMGDYFPVKMFAALKDFYQRAASAREIQISLKRATPLASVAP